MTIDVLIPVYNQEELVKRAIESVPDGWNIIACDDGSTDNTYEVLKSYPITVLKNRMNIGVGNTLNRLFDASKSDYHITLASDDYFLPAIEKVAEQLDGTDLVYFNMRNNKGRLWDMTEEIIVKHSHSTKFIRNAFMGDTRTDGSNYQEDVYLMRELVKKNPTMKFTHILAKHYNHPRKGSLSWQGRKKLIPKNVPIPVDKEAAYEK